MIEFYIPSQYRWPRDLIGDDQNFKLEYNYKVCKIQNQYLMGAVSCNQIHSSVGPTINLKSTPSQPDL